MGSRIGSIDKSIRKGSSRPKSTQSKSKHHHHHSSALPKLPARKSIKDVDISSESTNSSSTPNTNSSSTPNTNSSSTPSTNSSSEREGEHRRKSKIQQRTEHHHHKHHYNSRHRSVNDPKVLNIHKEGKLNSLPTSSLTLLTDKTYKNGQTDDPIIQITKFNDYRPQEKGVNYFQKVRNDGNVKKDLAVIIPCYNEPSHELQQTLNSLYDTFMYLKRYSSKWRNKTLYVLIVQDGWHRADITMQKWFYDMYPTTICGKPWNEYYDEFKPTFNDPTSNAMFVFERKDYAPTAVNTQNSLKEMRKNMKITILVKINNRRKHNSHEWFLGKNAFAEAVNAEYLLLTDAFTLYSESCLYYLVDQLDDTPDLIAVTGRQRLMSRNQQGSKERIFSFGFILRMIQLFDFELSNAVYNGAFSLGGLLPVIPGPCGLYRAEDLLKDNIRDAYFNLVNSEPSETGWVLANLRIAEDRVLSYYSVIKSEREVRMAFNPLAVFYFEAETELKKLMFQRRRWINGSAASYIYLLLIRRKEFWAWKTSLKRRFYMAILLGMQLLIYFTMGLSPGISIRILFFGIKYFDEYLEYKKSGEDEIKSGSYDMKDGIMFAGFFILYLIHIITHHKMKKDPYNKLIMGILVLVSLTTTVISFVALTHYYFVYFKYAFVDIWTMNNFILYTGLATSFGPFIVAACLGGKFHSPMYMVKSFLQYFLFMPLMIAWIGSYSYARSDDLSWGNKIGVDSLSDMSNDERERKKTEFKDKCQISMLVLAGLNFAIFWIPLQGVIYMMLLFFAISLYQMALSLIFCISRCPYKCKVRVNHIKKDKEYKRMSTSELSSIESGI